MVQEIRVSVRWLLKSPILTLAVVGFLAVGIAATTAVFAVVDALVLRPLPAILAPQELVALFSTDRENPERLGSLSWADYLDYAAASETVSGLAAFADFHLDLTQDGPAQRLTGLAVSDNYFAVLGVEPAHGRLFWPGEPPAPIAVLGHGLWQRRFGADTAVVGSPLVLNGRKVTVVGVAPEGFGGTDLVTRYDVWIPLGVYSDMATGPLAQLTGEHDRKQPWLKVVGRLLPGTSLEKARSNFRGIAERLAAAFPEVDGNRDVRVLPLGQVVFGERNRPRLLVFLARLMGVTAWVLAVAAINVAGLLVTRALSRRREIALQLSLGASRRGLLRSFLVEGAILGLGGCAAGVGLLQVVLPLLEKLELPAHVADYELKLSGAVLGFALLISLLSSLGATLLAGLQAIRTNLVSALHGEVPPSRHRRFGLRGAFVIAQVALALVILIASGLMIRTLVGLGSIEPGFGPERVLVASVDLAPAGYEDSRVPGFYRDLLERLRRLPGIAEASMASALPIMTGGFQVDLSVTPEERALTGDSPIFVRHALVETRFFRTVETKILRGRDFGAEDESFASGGTVIVNESAARQLWPERDPLGQRLRLVQTDTPFEVVGIVEDAIYGDLKEEALPVLYLVYAQYEKSFIGSLLAPGMTLLLRTTGEPTKVLPAVRGAVRAMEPQLPVFGVTTLEERLSSTIRLERQAAVLYSTLAVLAMALAMVGLYGALARMLLERTREIGVRMACGARPGTVCALMLRKSAFLSLWGIFVGLAVALPASRVVESQVYGVRTGDLATWTFSVLSLLCLALLVSVGPALRATRVSPIVALQHE